MATVVLRMAQGTPKGGWEGPPHFEPALAIAPPLLLGLVVLVLGLYIPPALSSALQDAARAVGGV